MIKINLYNQDVLTRFATLGKNKRLAHAYLFIGAKESSKTQTALAVAKWVNCEKNEDLNKNIFCDECPSCLEINSSNHPDIHIVEKTDGEFIKIEQIRGVLDQIKLRPFSGRKKVFIIRNIEFLSEESSNALLKTLEEPSLNSLLLLTSSTPDKVMDTIKSRCHIVPFLPVDKNRLAKYLVDQCHEDPIHAQVLAQFSEGALNKALRLQGDDFIKRRNEVLDSFIFSPWNENYVKALLADKTQTREFLDILLGWVRDAYCLKVGLNKSKMIHQDRFSDLERFQKKLSVEELGQLNRDIVNMYKLLTENLNIKMSLLIIKESLNK